MIFKFGIIHLYIYLFNSSQMHLSFDLKYCAFVEHHTSLRYGILQKYVKTLT